MKFLIGALFLVVAVAAQQQQVPADIQQARLVAELLVKRGEVVYDNARREAEELRKSGHEHLLQAFENEAALVEALTVDLKIQIHDLNKTHAVHHLHVVEEELLYREHRLTEEMAIIKEHQTHPTNPTQTLAQLVAKGEELVKKAQETIAKSPHAREAHAIEAEMFHIEDLLKALKEKPASGDVHKEQQQLARHEQTITQLLARLNKTH